MPAKPVWFGKLDQAIQELSAFPRPFVDRATIEELLGVGRRRAQQILAPCVTDRVGSNGLADREHLIAHLRRLAAGDERFYETRRQLKVAESLQKYRKELLERPVLLVEAPVRIRDQRFEDLPVGVEIQPGRITIEFQSSRQALEKLLALAMAIGNDLDRFEQKIAGT
jgi:hypothetical protein